MDPSMQMPDDDSGADQKSCVYVDPAILAEPGQDGQSDTVPGVGDTVDFTAAGKVTAIKGGKAEVTVTAVNGQPTGDGDAEPDADDQTEQGLRGQAATADSDQNYV